MDKKIHQPFETALFTLLRLIYAKIICYCNLEIHLRTIPERPHTMTWLSHKKFLVILLVLCSFLAVTGVPQAAHAAELQKLRYGPHPGKDRLVFDMDIQTDVDARLDGRDLVISFANLERPDFIETLKNMGPVESVSIQSTTDKETKLLLTLERNMHLAKDFWLLDEKTQKSPRYIVDLSFVPQKETHIEMATSDNQRLDALLNDIAGESEKKAALVNVAKDFPPLPLRKPNPEKLETAFIENWKPLIVIDAGHGGKDPGAIAHNGQREKDIVLKLARELKNKLDATGRYRTRLTRKDDRFIKLRERVNFARREKGDLFISLHADSIPDRDVTGASVYTLSDKASDAQTAKLAARENKADLIGGVDLSHEDKDVANILLDLVTRDTTNQSKFFANVVVEQFRMQGVKTLKTPHRHAGFAVLKAPDIPAILVENGFISSPSEVEKLNNAQHREKITSALLNSVDSYFSRMIALRAQ